MNEHNKRPELKLTGKSPLEILHDAVIAGLDSPDKAGIFSLLKKNNHLIKKELYNFLVTRHQSIDPEFFTALDNLLDLHARECYTIGYLDGVGKKQKECRMVNRH